MDSKDIETFVNAQQVLVANCEERSTRSQCADERCDVDGYEARGGRNTNQTSDNARAETDNRELLDKDVLEQDPCQATATCCKVGVADHVDGADRQVRGRCTCQKSVNAAEEHAWRSIPLKAYQPNQIKIVPRPTRKGLWGLKCGIFG